MHDTTARPAPPAGLDKAVWENALNNPFRIVRMEQDGLVMWLKKSAPSRGMVRYWALYWMSRWMDVHMLKAVPQPGGDAAIATESRRLKQLAAKGIRVPRIIWEQRDMLLLSDMGGPATRLIRSCRDDIDKKRAVIKAIFDGLEFVHQQGGYLSQGFVRNITFHGDDLNTIGFVDFEDDPLQVLSLPLAQARDLLLLIFSTARYFDNDQHEYQQLVHKQMNELPDLIKEQIKSAADRFVWIKRLPAKKQLGSDYHRLVSGLDAVTGSVISN